MDSLKPSDRVWYGRPPRRHRWSHALPPPDRSAARSPGAANVRETNPPPAVGPAVRRRGACGSRANEPSPGPESRQTNPVRPALGPESRQTNPGSRRNEARNRGGSESVADAGPAAGDGCPAGTPERRRERWCGGYGPCGTIPRSEWERGRGERGPCRAPRSSAGERGRDGCGSRRAHRVRRSCPLCAGAGRWRLWGIRRSARRDGR
jgi:hypothetical protein